MWMKLGQKIDVAGFFLSVAQNILRGGVEIKNSIFFTDDKH